MSVSVSVVIVTYNREKLLTHAIESVLLQEFNDFELIIIDDSSTDGTSGVVEKYLSDERVKYFKVNKCKSISEVRNAAWVHATGKYIAILDSDDIWCDALKLKKQFDFLENNPTVALVGSSAMTINDLGEKVGVIIKPELDLDIKKDFFVKNPFFHSSVMYRAESVKKMGGYDEKIRFGEDLDLWLRLGENWQLHNLPDVLIKYRVHNDNEASKHRLGAIADVLRVIKKNRKIYNASRFTFLKKILTKLSERFKSEDKI
ncbi:MAG: glycosyltransferase [Patescibacteria group bacterium]